MNQRFSLLNAGHCANAPACHFNEQALVSQHAGHQEQRVKAALDRLIATAHDKTAVLTTQLNTAEEIAKHFQLKVLPRPSSATEYFAWLPQYVEIFEEHFPMSRIDHYYFLFGRKCGELNANLRFAATCLELDIELDKALELQRRADKCIKDNEYILFKLIAPAALLSSEPRQNFFNVYYRKINSDFEPFRGIEVSGMTTDQMKELSIRLSLYEKELSSGLQQCFSQLQDLEV